MDDRRPEDFVEDAVLYLASKYDDTRLAFLEITYEGLLIMQHDPTLYFVEDVHAYVTAHFPEILKAARTLIAIEKATDLTIRH